MKSLPIHTRRHSPADRPRTTRFGHAILERSTNPRLPARSRDCHCASRSRVEADPVAPVSRSAELDRGPTSRLHHEAVFVASVSRSDAGDLTARGARSSASMFGPVSQTDHRRSQTVLLQPGLRCARFPERIVDREEVSCAADLAAPLGFPSGATPSGPHRPPVHVERHLIAPVARLDGARSPARVARAGDAGNLRPVSRASITNLTALGPSMKPASSPGFPGAHAVSLHGCPCFGGTHSPLCPRGVFPRHAVACVSSGVAVRSSLRPVARASGRRQR